jgi:hypothetical protein
VRVSERVCKCEGVVLSSSQDVVTDGSVAIRFYSSCFCPNFFSNKQEAFLSNFFSNKQEAFLSDNFDCFGHFVDSIDS